VGGSAFLEISWDGFSGWWPYPSAWKPVPGRLAVRLDDENLADIVKPSDNGTGDPLENNLAYSLLWHPEEIALRLTCCILAPDRHVVQPAATARAGTVFLTSEYMDRGAQGQVRKRASSSRLGAAGLWADESTGPELAQIASDAQSKAEATAIEAGFDVEWPDEPIALLDALPAGDRHPEAAHPPDVQHATDLGHLAARRGALTAGTWQ
jgi:hypothetical protein